jgi:protease I
MKTNLGGKKVAFVATNGFEQSELMEPREAFLKAGARVDIVSPESNPIRGWRHGEWTSSVSVDVPVSKAKAEDYDALVLPGGVINPDHLRRNPQVLEFVRGFFDAGKPVGAICHGPWTLIDAGVVRGRNMTSYQSIQTDLKNAGADWVDEAVVVDNGLVTSRDPDDLHAFIDKLIEEIAEGSHAKNHISVFSGAGTDVR